MQGAAFGHFELFSVETPRARQDDARLVLADEVGEPLGHVGIRATRTLVKRG
jgi:hypothetical protein